MQCQLDYLSIQRTPKAVRRALKELPQSIDETYDGMLSRIPEFDRNVARDALLWLSYAWRPLSLNELCEAVVLDDGINSLDEDSRLQHPRLILDICRGLITFNPESRRLALAHFSVKTYLTSDRIKAGRFSCFYLDDKSADTILAKKCLSYLRFPEFESGYCDWKGVKERQKSWPLLDYAAHTWATHTKAIGDNLDEALQQSIRDFFATSGYSQGGNFGAWVQILLPWSPLPNIQSTEPLYYASSFGLTSIVRTLLDTDKDLDIEAPGGRFGSTALHVACYRGRTDVVKILLEAGANPKSHNSVGETSLQWARRGEYQEIADLLVEYGAKE